MFRKSSASLLLSLLVAVPITGCIDSGDPAQWTREGDLRLDPMPLPTMIPMNLPAPSNVTVQPHVSGFAYTAIWGTTGADLGFNIAADSAGNAYMGGLTDQCPGSVGLTLLVVKLDPTGSVVYSVCFPNLGGGWGIGVDGAGNVYAGFGTGVLKLDPTGVPIYSVTLSQPMRKMTVDPSGNVYIASMPMATTLDVGVAKLNAAGTALVYNVAFGGSSSDDPIDIAVDGNGNAYVVGTTFSNDFPQSIAPARPVSGSTDGFAARLDPSGSRLSYSVLLGGVGADSSQGVAVDNAGNAYVVGVVIPRADGVEGFPVTSGAARVAPPGSRDAWAVRLGPTGAVAYATYVGGASTDTGFAVAVDRTTSAAVLTGSTSSTNFPNTAGIPLAVQDAFVVQLNPAGSAFSYARYLGGSSSDEVGLGVATDSSGHIYVTGFTSSPTFPTGGVATHGGRDAYVVKLDP
jgi:hypothetical protein